MRHLLIEFVDGSRETKLVQLSNGVETYIGTGTEYEMGQKADELVRLWVTNEGFRHPRKNEFAFEPLGPAKALAMKMGFTFLYDPRYRKMDRPPFNVTGAAPLSTWPGMTPKNGGGYVYAFDLMTLYARPTLPPHHEPLVAPSGGQEFAAFALKAIAILKTVGPHAEFILAGD